MTNQFPTYQTQGLSTSHVTKTALARSVGMFHNSGIMAMLATPSKVPPKVIIKYEHP